MQLWLVNVNLNLRRPMQKAFGLLWKPPWTSHSVVALSLPLSEVESACQACSW